MITKHPMTSVERRAVGSLAALYSIRMLGLFMVLPLLALYAVDLPGASPFLIGVALGAYGLTQAILQVPLGYLSDRIGRKPVIVAGLLVFALGSLVAGLADSMWGVVVGRMLQGAGAIAGTVSALVADLTRESQRTKAMALVGISVGLSFAAALVLGPLVAAWGGLSAVFELTAGLALLGIALLLWQVPTPVAPAAAAAPVASREVLLRSLRDPQLARLNLGIFSLHFLLMASFLVVPGVIATEAGVDRDAHWQVYLPTLGLSLLAMLPLFYLSERLGKPRPALLLSIVLMLLSLPALASVVGAYAVFAVLVVYFAAVNFLEASLPSLVSKLVDQRAKGTALGLYSTCQFLGAFCGGAMGGWLLQTFGTAALIGACVFLGLAWLFATLGLPEPAPRATSGSPEPAAVAPD